jgi:predicted component of type VI protein secretion system
MQFWYLEGYFHADGSIQKQYVDDFPFVIGREDKLPLTVAMSSVTRRHAVITQNPLGSLFLDDMGSSNGTFVNHERIRAPALLCHGDVIHLGNVEMRVMLDVMNHGDNQRYSTIIVPPEKLSSHFPAGVSEFDELLARKMVNPAYQSIVYHDNCSTFGYELLGRGAHPKLSESPGGLFQIAESVGL